MNNKFLSIEENYKDCSMIRIRTHTLRFFEEFMPQSDDVPDLIVNRFYSSVVIVSGQSGRLCCKIASVCASCSWG